MILEILNSPNNITTATVSTCLFTITTKRVEFDVTML